MAHYRNFDIEMTIVPDAAGQYEAAFIIHSSPPGKQGGKDEEARGRDSQDERRRQGHGEQAAGHDTPRANKAQVGDARDGRYAFPPVGSYLTPDDAREQTEAWARKWIDANFVE